MTIPLRGIDGYLSNLAQQTEARAMVSYAVYGGGRDDYRLERPLEPDLQLGDSFAEARRALIALRHATH